MRYKFYREHKYVSFALNNVERLIAKTDFRDRQEVDTVTKEFDSVINMLKGHAHYEDTCLHSLLKNKNSKIYAHIETDHKHLDETLAHLQELLKKVVTCHQEDEQVEAGYQFYLWFRKFVGDNLVHLHEEETVILPELQRLYTDEELKQVEAKTYAIMTTEQIIHMLEVLFPHMNPSDRYAFLADIKEAQPEKFDAAWKAIKNTLPPREQKEVVQKLNI